MDKIKLTSKENGPKYYLLKQKILKDIKEKKYLPGDKLPSEREFIHLYNVSAGTIKRALLELIKENIVYTVQGKGCFISSGNVIYKNNILSKKQIRRIVLIMDTKGVDGEYYFNLMQGLLNVIQPENFSFEMYFSEQNYRKETALIRRFMDEEISGLIIIPAFSEKSYRHLLQLKKKGVKVIVIANYLNKNSFDYVGISDYKGAEKAVKYLVKMGHRRIVFLGGGRDLVGIKERFNAYRNVLLKNKIKPDPELELCDDSQKFSSSEEEGYLRMKKFLLKKIKFTAIFAKSDDIAFGAYRALKEIGIRVPDDVSIIGFDDVKLAKNFEVPLTTVRQEPYRIGYTAGKLLLKKLEKDDGNIEKIFIKTKLIIRNSVKKIKNKG